jgi:hypothetical protein
MIAGDVGISPKTAIGVTGAHMNPDFTSYGIYTPATAFPNGDRSANAQLALTAAIWDAGSRPTTRAIPANGVYAPGVYATTVAYPSFAIASDITLDGGGDADAVFIFNIRTSLVVSVGKIVNLAGSAQAKNVFWNVGTSATLAADCTFEGTILADVSITADGTVHGRLLASTAAVTLGATTLSLPGL